MGAGPIDWDATLGGGREIPQPEATELSEPRPWIVTADEAAAFAEDMSWSVFPAVVRVDSARGKVEKLPALGGESWSVLSSSDPTQVKAMWDDRPALIAVDCRKSGLVVFDADSLPIDPDWWRDLTSTGTHVRRSVSGRGLHVFFWAPPEWDATTPVPGTWPYGEVKYRGYVVLSDLPVVTAAEVKGLPNSIRDRLRDEHRRESGPGGRAGSYGSRELTLAELDEWLDEEQVLETGAPEVFLGRVTDRLRDKVRRGTPRRTAAFEEVHVAAIESCAGLYTRRAAHDALLDAYRNMHEDDEWHRRRRELGYRRMWTYLAGADVAGSPGWTSVVELARAERGLPSHEEAGQFEAWLEARRHGGTASAPDVAVAGAEPHSTARAEAEESAAPSASAPPPSEGADEVPTATEGEVTPPEGEGPRAEIPASEPGVGERAAEGEAGAPQPTAEEIAAWVNEQMDPARIRSHLVGMSERREAQRKLDEIETAQQAALHGSARVAIDFGSAPPPLTPLSMLVRDDDGGGLASAERHAHLLVGSRSSGKSWLAQYLTLEQARRGRRVAYLDWEMNQVDVVRRLQAMGADPSINELFAYYPMSGRPVGSQLGELVEWAPDLVIVDSVVRSMGAEEDAPEGYENSSSYFVRWISRLERLRASASLFMIDHTGHMNPGRPRGSSAKMDQVDFAYSVEVVSKWSQSTAGSAVVTCRKSRAGELPQDVACAEMRVIPSRGGAAVDVQLLTPSATAALMVAAHEETSADAECRAKILALMSDGKPRSRTDLRKLKLAGSDRVVRAVSRLVEEEILADTPDGLRLAPS